MGGGTFKMCFQLCNTINPNSPQNTCVFSVFEAPDTYANLWIALHQFKEQIPKLEEKRWRYIILKKPANHTLHYYTQYVEERRYVCSSAEIISFSATCLGFQVLQVCI